MDKTEKKDVKSNRDEARRKLLKLAIYSVPAVIFLGRVTGARASGRGSYTWSAKDCEIYKNCPSQE